MRRVCTGTLIHYKQADWERAGSGGGSGFQAQYEQAVREGVGPAVPWPAEKSAMRWSLGNAGM
jgi:hypothetical protein